MKNLTKSKRGVLGLDTVKAVILSLLTLAVLFVAVVLALTTLINSNILPSGPASTNYTVGAVQNITSGGATFFTYVPTFFILLAVVVLILIIAIVIVAVGRFGGGMGGGNSM
jgi:uncharacterized membrane protein YfhO